MQQVLLQRHKMQGRDLTGRSGLIGKVALYEAKKRVSVVFTFCSYCLFSFCSTGRWASRVKRVAVGYVQLAVEGYRIGSKVYTKTTLPRVTRRKPYVKPLNFYMRTSRN